MQIKAEEDLPLMLQWAAANGKCCVCVCHHVMLDQASNMLQRCCTTLPYHAEQVHFVQHAVQVTKSM